MARTLTREEAEERAGLLEVDGYDVHLDLRDDDGFTSTTTVRFRCRRPGAGTFLELDAELLSMTRGGEAVTPEVTGNRIALRDLAAEEVVTVTSRGRWSTTGEGLQRSTDPADGRTYVFSQCFLDDAQQLVACFDQPDLKAHFALTVDAPEDWVVLSTTGATTTAPGRHVFDPTPPLPTYLLCLAAGPWHGASEVVDGIELSVWCRQSVADALPAGELLELTAAAMAFQQQVFGRAHPFGDRYAQVFVPDFIGGAMENPAMVTFSEERFLPRGRTTDSLRRGRGMVIAHELAHMWFGDLVTMRWWDDLWLNEAFAEMLGFHTVDRALPFEGAWDEFGILEKAWGYRTDAYPTTHPVTGDVTDTRAALHNFDGISYAKGAAVLRQLMAWLGEDAFFAGVRDYVERHAWGSTSLDDLLAALERASGRDLGAWADAWLRTTGFDVLRVEDGAVVRTGDERRPHRTGVAAYDEVGGRLVLRDAFEVDVVGGRTEVPGLAPADLVLPNHRDLTYAAVRFDARSLASLHRGLGTLAEPLDRVVAWGGLWDSCREAELPAATFVDAVAAHLGAESDPGLVEALLQQARTAATLWSADPQVAGRLHARLLELLAGAEPGGDVQLLLLKAAADTAAPGDLLLGWLDGGALPDGVALDADLRWHLLAAAAAVGAVDAARVDAALAADRTDAGARGAGRARAALPDAAAKERVWQELVHDPAVSAPRVRTVSLGFWQPGQDPSPWVDRFFAEVPAVFAERSAAVGPAVVRGLYPRTVVDAGVVARTDALLDGELPASLRRCLLEVADDLRRAVRARAAG